VGSSSRAQLPFLAVTVPYLQKYYLFECLQNPTSNARFLSTALKSCLKSLDFCKKRPSHI
jgi:hypothetical protein